ncbi:hypothetical protein E2562_026024 [Oryza meyeriana var. granulata]|uniref:ABC transmembrane type-1 domain-containing protein n=1 Tax=Oryza meyeriana var. granulata TaxID=110450 RepID=A0A6G1EPH7_9ORYZ|nr:hypothetical protein E2562_026024 [Oryza meyeriana var. granulata]
MAAGAAGAVASGAAQPLMNLIFGEIVDGFGSGSRDDVLRGVSKARPPPRPHLLLYPILVKVASFNGENRAIALCNKYIQNAYVSAVQESIATGLGVGLIMFILFCTYGLAAWYGARLIIDKGYEGGQVVTVWMAVMTGGIMAWAA